MRPFKKSDVVVLLVIAVVVVGLVLILRPIKGIGHRVRCMSQVRNLVGLLESAGTYPGDRNLLLYLVEKSELRSADELELLFCPGDSSTRDEHGTSYAWRDQRLPGCRVVKGAAGLVLICDDSDDHHEGKGFVFGYTGGTAKWRDKIDDWGLREHARVTVGKDSVVPELRCLRAD